MLMEIRPFRVLMEIHQQDYISRGTERRGSLIVTVWADMAQPTNEYLRFGDTVFLLDDEFGPMQGHGFGMDVSVGIVKTDVEHPAPGAFSNVSVFTIWHQVTLNAAVALKEYEDSTDGDSTRRTPRGGETHQVAPRPTLPSLPMRVGGKCVL